MAFTYTFDDGTTMTSWDPVILQTHQAERAEAYEARWGKSSCPVGSADLVEQSRCFFWVFDPATSSARRSIAKCFGCRNGNLRMPTGNNRPDGSDDEDLLPCGCDFRAAMVELVLARAGKFGPGAADAAVFPPAPGVVTRGISSEMKPLLWELVVVLHGPNVTVDDLVSGNTRVATLGAAVATGSVAP